MTCQACVLQQKGAVGAKHPTEIGDTHLLRPSAILLVGRHCVTGMKVRMGEMVNKPTFALAAKACLGLVPSLERKNTKKVFAPSSSSPAMPA